MTSRANRARNEPLAVITTLLCIVGCLFITLLPAITSLSDTGATPPQSPAPMPAPIPTPTPTPISVPDAASSLALDMRCAGGDGPLFGVGRALCEANGWVAAAVAALGRWVALGWPLAALAILTVLVAMLLWLARAISRLKAAEGAVWLEITSPATSTSAGGLWRMLDGCLRLAPGARPWAARPVLAAEWWADPSGLRAGIWVPSAVRPERVTDAITRAWPDATVRPTHPPIWQRYPTRLLELAPTAGPWAPLIHPTSRPGGVDQASDEPLRAVLGALADLAPGEQATVQLIVSAHSHPLAGRGGGVAGALRAAAPALLGSLAGALAGIAVMLLDLLTGSPTTSRRTSSATRARSAGATGAGADPVLSAARAAETAKRTAGPHLSATLRIGVSVPMPHDWRHDRARAVDIANGYQLATRALRPRWRRSWVPEQLTLRTHSRRAWIATLPELAALWHAPAEPDRYRMPAPRSHERDADGATRFRPEPPTHPHTDTHTDTDARRPRTARPGHPPSPPERCGGPAGRRQRRVPNVGPNPDLATRPAAHPPTRPASGPAHQAPPGVVSRFSRPARSSRARDGGEHR